MATTVSLLDIKRAADKKYGAYVIKVDDEGNTITLLPMLKVSREKRDALEALEEENVDPVDMFARWARIVAKTDAEADLLIELIGDDLSYWKELQEGWAERTQPGEASPSES